MAEALNDQPETCKVVSPEDITHLPIDDGCKAFAWHSNDEWIAIASGIKINIWNVTTGEVETKINVGGTICGCMKWNNPGTVLAFGTKEGFTCKIWIWRSSGEATQIGNGETLGLEWNPCGELFLTAQFERTCTLWNTERIGPLRTLWLKDYAWSVAWQTNNVFAVGLDSNVHIYQVDSDEPLRIMKVKPSPGNTNNVVTSMAWNSSGELLACGSQSGSLRVWNLNGCLPGWKNCCQPSEIREVKWINNEQLVSISKLQIRIWNLKGYCLSGRWLIGLGIEEGLPILSPNGRLWIMGFEIRCALKMVLKFKLAMESQETTYLRAFNKTGDKLAIFETKNTIGIVNLKSSELNKGNNFDDYRRLNITTKRGKKPNRYLENV